MSAAFSSGDQVQYRSPNDEHDVVGDIELVIKRDNGAEYTIWHPLFGYETVDESRIYYKLDN